MNSKNRDQKSCLSARSKEFTIIDILKLTSFVTGTVLNDGGLMYPEIEYGEMWESYGPKFLAIKGSFNLSETTHEEHLDAQLIKHFYTGVNLH